MEIDRPIVVINQGEPENFHIGDGKAAPKSGDHILVEQVHPAVIDALGGASTIRERWEQGDLLWRRSLLRAVVDHVVILEAIKGLNKFDPSRVQIVWRV